MIWWIIFHLRATGAAARMSNGAERQHPPQWRTPAQVHKSKRALPSTLMLSSVLVLFEWGSLVYTAGCTFVCRWFVCVTLLVVLWSNLMHLLNTHAGYYHIFWFAFHSTAILGYTSYHEMEHKRVQIYGFRRNCWSPAHISFQQIRFQHCTSISGNNMSDVCCIWCWCGGQSGCKCATNNLKFCNSSVSFLGCSALKWNNNPALNDFS
jgi:hypothetical protein